MRVLVVSESADVRSRSTTAMRANPEIELLEAASAGEGHDVLAGGDVDVVVMDGDMRPEGGYSVAYELRAAAELRDEQPPPVIMLMGREHDRWLAHWAGAVAAFTKPVDPFAIAERVADLGTPDSVPEPTGDPALAMEEPAQVGQPPVG
jgi:DNA-binding response OmpR family regulator